MAFTDFMVDDIVIQRVLSHDNWGQPVVSTVLAKGRFESVDKYHISREGQSVEVTGIVFLPYDTEIVAGDIVHVSGENWPVILVQPVKDKYGTGHHLECAV